LPARSSIHLCEHAAERAYLHDGSGPYLKFLADRGATSVDWAPPGLDPVRYAASLGALANDVIAVHLTDARPDELALVADAGVPVVLCPRSNLHIELKLPPLIEMLKAGIRPALGTDSLASNSSLDVLEEARALAARFPSVAPRILLAMATRYGAEVLGLQSRVGSLSQGLAPGVLAFPHDAEPLSDPERFVLSKAASRRTLLVPPSLHPLLAEEAA
jgi:cytosine/adenosine deaminase-related metal-dependent hydrolase